MFQLTQCFGGGGGEGGIVKNKQQQQKQSPQFAGMQTWLWVVNKKQLFVDSLPCLFHNQTVSHHIITNSLLCEACCGFIVGYITLAKTS